MLSTVPETQTRMIELHGRRHRLDAEWQWPLAPAVSIRLGDRDVASVDYFPASASAHWALHWISGDVGSAQLPLIGLAGRVPEEIDADPALQAATLDIALDAAEDRLTGQPARVERPDA